MKIGFMGLGKLGLPVALAIEAAGHKVMGYDPSPVVLDIFSDRSIPYLEQGANDLFSRSKIDLWNPMDMAEWADLIFVTVQTPHEPRFEGATRLPEERADFDYTYLREAVAAVCEARQIVIVSTVLPGTLEREIAPVVSLEKVLYNPSFIAMGTTIPDFRNPEFVLVGTDGAHPRLLRELYATIHNAPVFVTTIKTAELTKVAYNTFIGLKIVFANAMMEICEKTGADVDDLVDALGLAHRRLISTMYMRGGMGDGGGCHPRDNIALSWLARELDLSYDLFEAMMVARERQTEWLAELALEGGRGEIEILGEAYKPGTNLTTGSPARLLAEMLREKGAVFEQSDPYVTA
jgi:UDPglucose 6-dehydrogenase